jgi:hypothetical protein
MHYGTWLSAAWHAALGTRILLFHHAWVLSCISGAPPGGYWPGIMLQYLCILSTLQSFYIGPLVLAGQVALIIIIIKLPN